MEKHEFILHPSLQEMAVLKVAINVWNQPENLILLKLVDYERLAFPEKVKGKVSLLVLPKKIKQKLLNALEPIALEMLRWMKRHITSLHDPGYFLDKLCWTSVGTVDNRKTAKTLIKLQRIDISSKYRLACEYCFEDDIFFIWKKLPNETKLYFIERSKQVTFENRQFYPVAIWTYIMNDEEGELMSKINASSDNMHLSVANIYQFAFANAATGANKEAAEFFLRKLTPSERELFLVSTAQRVVIYRGGQSCYGDPNKLRDNFSNVIVYLLSQMDKEEQRRVFRMKFWPTMLCFLDWPWYNLFIRVAKISFNYLDNPAYELVIKTLIKDYKICGYYFPKLFEEFLLEVPCHVKDYLIELKSTNAIWFRLFFETCNTECIQIMLKTLASSSEREKLIISDRGLSRFVQLMKEHQWFLLELIIKESTLSEKAKTRLKSILMKPHWQCKCKRSQDWDSLFYLIDNANVENCSKRNLEDMDVDQRPTKILKRKEILNADE